VVFCVENHVDGMLGLFRVHCPVRVTHMHILLLLFRSFSFSVVSIGASDLISVCQVELRLFELEQDLIVEVQVFGFDSSFVRRDTVVIPCHKLVNVITRSGVHVSTEDQRKDLLVHHSLYLLQHVDHLRELDEITRRVPVKMSVRDKELLLACQVSQVANNARVASFEFV